MDHASSTATIRTFLAESVVVPFASSQRPNYGSYDHLSVMTLRERTSCTTLLVLSAPRHHTLLRAPQALVHLLLMLDGTPHAALIELTVSTYRPYANDWGSPSAMGAFLDR